MTHWLVVTVLVLTGMLIGDLISEHKVLTVPRYWIYSLLQRASWTSPTYSNRVYIVTITDEEFWKGELASRTPLKRQYLAKLISRIDSTHPKVIALDVDLDLRSFNKDINDYCMRLDSRCNGDDVNDLRKAIMNCGAHVVLPRALIFEGGAPDEPVLLPSRPREYLIQPSLFHVEEFGGHVTEGYVSLPYDIRQVPLVVNLKSGQPVESFAAAIARVWDKDCVELARGKEKDSLPYGTFLSSKGFKNFTAAQVLNPSQDLQELGGNVVLIGGTWHQQAYREGRQVDLHQTPVGEIGGVLVHANYVEALLSHLTIKPLGKARSFMIELVLSILIALAFAWDMSPRKQIMWVGLVCLVSIFISLIAWQNLGLFFDFSIPLLLLGGHTALEKVREWRSDSRLYQKLIEEGKVPHA